MLRIFIHYYAAQKILMKHLLCETIYAIMIQNPKGKERYMFIRKPNRNFGAVACILGVIGLIVNGLIFLALFTEQIKTGWGAGTRYEMLTLLFWLAEILTLPLLLTEIVDILYEIFKKNSKQMLIANAIILAVNILFIALTNVFIFY